MDMSEAQIWLVAGIVLFIAEIITPGFVLANFGVAAFVSAGAAWLGADITVQIIVFVVSSVISFIVVRPILSKTMLKEGKGTLTGVEAIIGREAKVTADIPHSPDAGRVKLDGDSWRAMSVSGDPIASGVTVKIERVESTTIYVTPVDN